MRGKDKDEIILNILKEGAKTPIELREETIRHDVSRSTFYKHIKKLVNSGEVKDAKYELIIKIEEANRKELDEHLTALIKDNNERIILRRLKRLTKLSWNKRMAHYPNVIEKISSLLDKTEVVDNDDNLSQLFECLSSILLFEQNNQGEKWKGVMERLVNATIEKATVLLLKCPNSRITEYFGKTNRKNAVDLIFRLMKMHHIELGQNEYCNIIRALGRNGLYKHHNTLILSLIHI